jgi:elongation factor Ts
MQVAALRARWLSREDVPADIVEGERRVFEEKTRAEGKPEQAVAKIVEGRLGGFYKDNVLLEQESVRESGKSVKQVLDAAGVTVTKFAHFEVGQV